MAARVIPDVTAAPLQLLRDDSLLWDRPATLVEPEVPSRGWSSRGECLLWLAVVEDAKSSAALLGRGRRLLGMDVGLRSFPAAVVSEVTTLRAWATGAYVGSLQWIADELSGSAGINVEPDAVRAFILSALDGGHGNGAGCPRRSRAAARGKARIVSFRDGR